MKKILTSLLMLSPFMSNAMSIDTMLKVADKNGQGTYVVTNDQRSPAFINVNLAKIYVKNGKVIKDYYNKDNLLSWEVSATQNKFVLDSGMRKMVGVRALCADSCDPTKDSVYAVQFSPSPYSKDGNTKAGVSISYGYESIFVIPAKKKNISYSIVKKDSIVNLKNESNTTLQVFFNQCSAMFKSDCSIKTILLPGKIRSIKLPKNAQKGDINTIITTVDDDFYKKEVLSNGQNIHFTKKIDK
ncbi:hypothetical protein HWA77_20360 [Photobacterium damselae subsp. damselae]|uniref:Molecular chaperone n=1 Tax=Photobacterium damselae subsp. damselae TaxID=85581 RepID=A0A850R1Z7_PHODD|nr:hypothetical protein [Photobacterium damselae subsp. damselae]